jgi:hypothetical protein
MKWDTKILANYSKQNIDPTTYQITHFRGIGRHPLLFIITLTLHIHLLVIVVLIFNEKY